MSDAKETYERFIAAVPHDDLLAQGLPLHMVFMTKVMELDPDNAPMIGRMNDALIGSVIIQHLEAAHRSPDSIPDVIALLRKEIGEKLGTINE